MKSGRSSLIFRKNVLSPSSGSNSKSSKQPAEQISGSIAYLAYSSTMKMEVVSFSESLVSFYEARWRHVPKDNTLTQPLLDDYFLLVGCLA
jgi:hypothetical protein